MRRAQLPGVVRKVLAVGGLIFFSLSAWAQSGFLPAESAYSAAQPLFIPAGRSVSFLPDHPIALQTTLERTNPERAVGQQTGLKVTLIPVADRSMAVRMAGSFEKVKTPFLNQLRVPLISMASGRVQLSGFRSIAPMQNLVCGLPLKANASGGSVVQQCHPGVHVPRNLRSYGLSLHFRFAKQDADRDGNGLWHGARQAASWGRAFFTL